jgi:hypothetical protein
MTSGFVRVARVALLILLTSHPIRSGALLRTIEKKCETYSDQSCHHFQLQALNKYEIIYKC